MDQLVNEHFGFEATDDVDGVVGTLSDDAEHEVIPSPVGALNDPGPDALLLRDALRQHQGRGRDALAAPARRELPSRTVARSSATARAGP